MTPSRGVHESERQALLSDKCSLTERAPPPSAVSEFLHPLTPICGFRHQALSNCPWPQPTVRDRSRFLLKSHSSAYDREDTLESSLLGPKIAFLPSFLPFEIVSHSPGWP